MRSSALYALISLSGMMFGAEIVASHVTQSLALLISAYHMLYNILSLLLLVLSYRMSRGRSFTNTFGWARLNVVGLLVNMLFLVALCFAACVEAVQTVVHAAHEDTEPRHPALLVALGGANLLLNLLCFALIGGYTHHQGCSMITQGDKMPSNCDLREAGEGSVTCNSGPQTSIELPEKVKKSNCGWCGDHQVLDVTRDISSALAVIACGLVILLLNGLILKYADAILAVASVVVLLCTTYPFVRESGLILLQSIPSHIDVEGLTQKLLREFPDVQNVHDLHVWRLTASEVIVTVHVILLSPEVYAAIKADLNHFFVNESISSVTIQPEFVKATCPDSKSECILQCSPEGHCRALTCCGPLTHGHGAGGRPHCHVPNPHRRRVDVAQVPDAGRESPPGMASKRGSFEQDSPLLGPYDFAKMSSAMETKV